MTWRDGRGDDMQPWELAVIVLAPVIVVGLALLAAAVIAP